MWQLTTAFLRLAMSWLDACPASAPYLGPLCDAWMGLYVSPTAPVQQTSTMANITEASYDGYARQEIVWLPTFIALAGPQTIKGTSLWWQPTGGLTPNVITGAFLASAVTGGVLYAGAVAPGTGFPLNGTDTGLMTIPVFQLPFSQIYGGPEWDG